MEIDLNAYDPVLEEIFAMCLQFHVNSTSIP